MSNYKLIAFDMDGTLLDSEKKIPAETVDMIHRAVSAGKLVCLGTGRCLPELEEFFPVLPDIRYIIGESGVFVYDRKADEYIYSSPLKKEIAVEIFRRVQASGEDIMFHIHCDRSIVQADSIPRMKDYRMDVYQPMFDRICTKVPDICSFFLSAPFAPNKVNIYCKSEEQWERIYRLLSDIDIEFKHVEGVSLECIPKDQTKGNGLKKLCEHLSIPMEKTIAVGDADNDIEMLSTAGLAIAMGNSNDNVKQIADVIVADNDHGGCVQAIRDYLL